MTFQAKSNAAMMAILALVYGAYALVVANQVADTAVDDLTWQPLMLLTVVPVTVLAIVAHIVIAVMAPDEADDYDERDHANELRGESLGGLVLGAGVFGGLVLAMFEAHPFWIAQVLLAGLVLSEIVKDARTLQLYRRGA
ncbi:MAG: hypothetical protein ACR2QO_21820 [Acidimicrobiales bacterium]